MISLAKVLFTIAAIIGVFAAFRALKRWTSPDPGPTPAQRAARAAEEAVRRRTAHLETELARCPRCGVFHDTRSPCGCPSKGGPEN